MTRWISGKIRLDQIDNLQVGSFLFIYCFFGRILSLIFFLSMVIDYYVNSSSCTSTYYITIQINKSNLQNTDYNFSYLNLFAKTSSLNLSTPSALVWPQGFNSFSLSIAPAKQFNHPFLEYFLLTASKVSSWIK